MQVTPDPISVCRHCKFYRPEGRRGGHCEKLEASVQSQWQACSLACHPFAPDWNDRPHLAIAHRLVTINPALAAQAFTHHQSLTICQPMPAQPSDRPVTLTALARVDEHWRAERTASA